MNLNELRDLLNQMLLLKQMPADMRDRILMVWLKISRESILVDGDTLFEEGDTEGDSAYILLRGQVLVKKSDMPELEVPAPELLGEIKPISTAQKRTATVRVQDEAIVLEFSWREFFTEAQRVFNASELDALKKAIETIAWEHAAG